jgi:hypothetical protein
MSQPTEEGALCLEEKRQLRESPKWETRKVGPFWNSLESVSSALNWARLALVLAGTLTLLLSAAQYKLSLRKDFLSGTSQKEKELALNKRVSQASQDAANSIKELGDAKKSLAETQEQFASAAKDAENAVRQLSAANQTIDELRSRSGKVQTLALRFQLTFETDPITAQMETNQTYMDAAPVAALATPNRKVLLFGAQQSRGLQISTNTRVHAADLQILDQASIAGRNIASLADYSTLAIGIGPYLKQIGLNDRVHVLKKAEVYLRINGTEIKILEFSDDLALVKLNNGEAAWDIASSMSTLAKRYDDLMNH